MKKDLKRLTSLLIIVVLASLTSCYSPPKKCDFCPRLVETKLLTEDYNKTDEEAIVAREVEIKNIKANNIDACELCYKYKKLQKCKETLKQKKIIERQNGKRRFWIF